jgi:hypothetical protein
MKDELAIFYCELFVSLFYGLVAPEVLRAFE